MEPMVHVPPAMTQAMLTALVNGGCIARHWQLGGRYGSRIAVEHSVPGGSGDETSCKATSVRPRRTIPVLPWAAEAIAAFLEAKLAAPRPGGGDNVGQPPLPDELCSLLLTGHVELHHRPHTQPRAPQAAPFDATVHVERMPLGFTIGAAALYGWDVALPSHTHRQHGIKNGAPPCTFRFVELFAGIGGFSLGLTAIGGRCVFTSEVAEPAKSVLRRNFPDAPPVAGDIWGVDADDIPAHDLLVGGFPCQPFSALGEQPGLADRKGVGDTENRGQLFTQIVRVLDRCQPAGFILENVPGLLTTGQGRALQTIVSACTSCDQL
jgi:hypothetical protein